MARRLWRAVKVLRFLNVMEPGRLALSPKRIAAWLALLLALYAVLAGRDAPLMALLSLITG